MPSVSYMPLGTIFASPRRGVCWLLERREGEIKAVENQWCGWTTNRREKRACQICAKTSSKINWLRLITSRVRGVNIDKKKRRLWHNFLNCQYTRPPKTATWTRCDDRLYPILLRAGATLQTRLYYDDYLLKVRAAGGFRRYERDHLNALAATFLPKLPRLPPELVRRIVEYAFHVGDY